MGFNKRFLPKLEDLKSIRDRMEDDNQFLRIYLYGPDAIIGSEESLQYVRLVESEIKEVRK